MYFNVSVKTGAELTGLGAWMAHLAALPFLVTAVSVEPFQFLGRRRQVELADLGKDLACDLDAELLAFSLRRSEDRDRPSASLETLLRNRVVIFGVIP